MNYELRLPPDTQNEIREYLNERFGENLADYLAALAAILGELEKLAVNPGLGSVHYGGPFESRPTYPFSFTAGGVTRVVKVVYSVLKADRVVVISGFEPDVPLM